MNSKYRIRGSSAIVSMSISFSGPEGESTQILVDVDFANDRVYFNEKKEGVDYVDLEQEILRHLRPEGLQAPVLNSDIRKQINDVRKGMFQGKSIYDGVK